MSISGKLRQEARECLARAKTVLAQNQIATTRHAWQQLKGARRLQELLKFESAVCTENLI